MPPRKKPVKLPNMRQLTVLSILIGGEEYGRGIRDQYYEQTGETLPLGSLYTTLDRMEDAGLLKSRMGESAHARGGNRRKFYRVTETGEKAWFAYLERMRRQYGLDRCATHWHPPGVSKPIHSN